MGGLLAVRPTATWTITALSLTALRNTVTDNFKIAYKTKTVLKFYVQAYNCDIHSGTD
jgi:hypothetical protein